MSTIKLASNIYEYYGITIFRADVPNTPLRYVCWIDDRPLAAETLARIKRLVRENLHHA